MYQIILQSSFLLSFKNTKGRVGWGIMDRILDNFIFDMNFFLS